MKFITYIFLVITTFFYTCKSNQAKLPVETVEFDIGSDTKSFVPSNDKKAIPMISFIKDLEEKSSSFSADFIMKVVTPQETNSINGRIFFEKEGKKCKIQMLDPFFGAIISQVLANPNQIKIKQGGNDKLYEQKMGDILLTDPTGNKKFTIPFPVIFYSIAQDFTQEINSGNSLVNPTEKKFKVMHGNDEYLYIFYEGGLESLEFFSRSKNIQAKAKVSETSKKGIHPPDKILSKVSEVSSGKNLTQVDIQFKNIKRVLKIPEKEFKL